jgi:hypothetical protein
VLDLVEGSSQLIAGYPDGRLALYDFGDRFPLATRLPVTVPAGSPANFDQANAIRRDGKVMAWFEQAMHRVRLQDDRGAALPDVPIAEASFVEAIALSDDGTRLVTVEAREAVDTWTSSLLVRSLPDGEIIHEEPLGPYGYRIDLSSDGERLLIGDPQGGLRLRGLVDGAVVWDAPADPERRSIGAVELSDDGRTARAGAVLGAGPFGRAALLTWDVTPGAATSDPEVVFVNADRVSAIATAPDGRRFLSASDAQSAADGQLLVVEPGETRATGDLGGPRDNIAVLRLAPDGRLLSGGPQGWFAWTIDRDAWTRLACAIAARELTPAEWREAFGDLPQAPTCALPPDAPPDPSATPPAASSSPSPAPVEPSPSSVVPSTPPGG